MSIPNTDIMRALHARRVGESEVFSIGVCRICQRADGTWPTMFAGMQDFNMHIFCQSEMIQNQHTWGQAKLVIDKELGSVNGRLMTRTLLMTCILSYLKCARVELPLAPVQDKKDGFSLVTTSGPPTTCALLSRITHGLISLIKDAIRHPATTFAAAKLSLSLVHHIFFSRPGAASAFNDLMRLFDGCNALHLLDALGLSALTTGDKGRLALEVSALADGSTDVLPPKDVLYNVQAVDPELESLREQLVKMVKKRSLSACVKEE
jgi:hypothetical protein